MEQFDYLWNAEDDRYHGPYDRGQGAKAAEAFNQFILPDVFKAMGAKAKGPWYVVPWSRIPAPQQRELVRLYNS